MRIVSPGKCGAEKGLGMPSPSPRAKALDVINDFSTHTHTPNRKMVPFLRMSIFFLKATLKGNDMEIWDPFWNSLKNPHALRSLPVS